MLVAWYASCNGELPKPVLAVILRRKVVRAQIINGGQKCADSNNLKYAIIKPIISTMCDNADIKNINAVCDVAHVS